MRGRSLPVPLLVVFLVGVGALFWIERDPPAERVPGSVGETALTEAVAGFEDAWAIAERVLRERDRRDFTLRTLLADVGADRDGPPGRLHLAFRSWNEERDFFIQIDNAELEVTVSAVFPTSPRLRALPVPEPVYADDVIVDLAAALARADSLRPEGREAGVTADVLLRATEVGPEWRVSYSRETNEGIESVAAVVLDATTGEERPDAPGEGG